MIANISHSRAPRRQLAFSLVEVVLALGVIAVGVIAILGAFPTALQIGHSAQDETRATHIAQSLFGILVSQAPTQFNNSQLHLADNTSLSIDLTAPPGTSTLCADNDGNPISATAQNATYAITIYTNNSVPGFTDPASANEVTVRVLWPHVPNQGPTPAPNQTYRDYVRIISKY